MCIGLNCNGCIWLDWPESAEGLLAGILKRVGLSTHTHNILQTSNQHHHQIVSINTFPLLGLVKISLKMVYGNGTTAEVHDIGGGRQYM